MSVNENIKKWLLDTSKVLNLDRCGLKEWPELLNGKEHFIVELYCSWNQLKSLPVLTKCVSLDCSNNQLTSLPSLILCVTLDCSGNQLTSLPALPNCNWLQCYNNLLTSLPPLPNCVALFCRDNLLISLPALPKCVNLYCYGNQLISLPVLPNCVELYCPYNQLFSTNLSDWKKLWRLKSSIYRTRGIKKFLRILKLRLHLPRLDQLHDELLKSPNHPGKFYQIPLLKAWNKYKKSRI